VRGFELKNQMPAHPGPLSLGGGEGENQGSDMMRLLTVLGKCSTVRKLKISL
jgi:hypothetical protein